MSVIAQMRKSSFVIVLAVACLHPLLTVAQSSSALISRCAEIAALDQRFGPLARACQYALSPDDLPNFVCTQEEQQLTHYPYEKYWRQVALVTAEVTFVQGQDDQYSNVWLNGSRISNLEKSHTGDEVATYFKQGHLGGMRDWHHFGEYLLAIFSPRDHATFEYKGEINMEGTPLAVFGFRIKRKDNNSNIGIDWERGSFSPGFEGLIWTDKTTSFLRRVVVHDTDIDASVPASASSTATDYGFVNIADLGQFLLPIRGETVMCNRKGRCWRNLLTFKNCRKFAATSRILPGKAK